MPDKRTLPLNILGVSIVANCGDEFSLQLLHAGYSAFLSTVPASPDRVYDITPRGNGAYELTLRQGESLRATDDYELLYYFEKSITLEIQKQRTDLLFLHGAALEYQGRCCLFTAASGSGKSTTAWAALHHGFNYLSDELAPVIPASGAVDCYPHALCLKQAPPAPYHLPAASLHTSRTLHVPVEALPCQVVTRPQPLTHVFFVRYDPTAAQPSARPVSTAECGARLYSNALNLMAHARYGLDAVIAVAARCRGFDLITNDLAASCALVRQLMTNPQG